MSVRVDVSKVCRDIRVWQFRVEQHLRSVDYSTYIDGSTVKLKFQAHQVSTELTVWTYLSFSLD
jgi:hypothetical protein